MRTNLRDVDSFSNESKIVSKIIKISMLSCLFCLMSLAISAQSVDPIKTKIDNGQIALLTDHELIEAYYSHWITPVSGTMHQIIFENTQPLIDRLNTDATMMNAFKAYIFTSDSAIKETNENQLLTAY